MEKGEKSVIRRILGNFLRGEGVMQFTWMEMLFMPLMVFSYIGGYVVSIIIIFQKSSYEDPPSSYRYIYPLLFVMGHTLAGATNLRLHYKDINDGVATSSWGVHLLFFFLSPLTRYYRAVKLGRKERQDSNMGVRFLDECVKAGTLRLCECLVSDVPFLVLLMTEDIWTNYDQWTPEPDDDATVAPDSLWYPTPGYKRWMIVRLLFLTSKVSQSLAFFSIMLKRQHHLHHPAKYLHLKSNAAKQGRFNIFGTLLLFAGHATFTVSRTVGYSIAAASYGLYVLVVIGCRWCLHVIWYSFSFKIETGKKARPMSSMIIGAVWLTGLTNPNSSHQLGKFLLFASFAILESIICGAMWYSSEVASENPFSILGILIVLAATVLWLLIRFLYYTLCHPTRPNPSCKGLMFCYDSSSGDASSALEEAFSDEEESVKVNEKDKPLNDMDEIIVEGVL